VIAYNLACTKGHEFEGWFRDSASYDVQEADGALTCPVCGDGKVRKAIMSPSVKTTVTKSKGRDAPAAAEPVPTRKQYVAGLRKFIAENAEYVGPRFAEEARKMHYGETEHRHIYGESTVGEAKELIEEGIDIAPIPPDPDDLN
jgi:hypothetical protein